MRHVIGPQARHSDTGVLENDEGHEAGGCMSTQESPHVNWTRSATTR
jgi:hypothetical protein